MHTEHLQNVTVTRVATGWLIAIAVTSLAVFVFEASGIGTAGAGAMNAIASFIAVGAGFGAGGFVIGFRARRAPILHGVGMGIASIVVWAVINIVASSGDWAGLGVTVAIGLVLAQMIAAVVGALLGYNIALRGKPGLSEDFPVDDPPV